MVNDELFTDRVLHACARAAGKVARTNKSYVEQADVLSEMYVWILKHKRQVAEWLEDGQHGMNKLGVALYRAGHKFAALERARRTGCQLSDFYWYTEAVLTELLPDVWDYQDWFKAPTQEHVRGRQQPSEGGNRQAMMIDVAWAVSTLEADDQTLLRDRFQDAGSSTEVIAAKLGITEDGARKKIDRLIAKLIERLGGEPPFFQAGRRAKSNSQAVSETKSQEL